MCRITYLQSIEFEPHNDNEMDQFADLLTGELILWGTFSSAGDVHKM